MIDNQKVWHVIGNGPGNATLSANELNIRFNQNRNSKRTALTVTNSNLAKTTGSVHLSGIMPCDGFWCHMEQEEQKLIELLNCKPSVGLLTVATLKNLQLTIRISCMNLLPSLIRPKSYGKRRALPATYHNWLGERRLAFDWQGLMDWPDYKLRPPVLVYPKSSSAVSFDELAKLPDLTHRQAQSEICRLSNIDPLSWVESVTIEQLISAEKLFFLPRHQSETKNWWLYDEAVSGSMALT